MAKKDSAAATVRNIRRKMRKKYSAEEKIRLVMEGLRGERLWWQNSAVAQESPRVFITSPLKGIVWSKEFLEAGKQRLAGNTSAKPIVKRSVI